LDIELQAGGGSERMKVLVTGGAGYIGSHTCVELLQAGHEIVVVDNLCNSKVEVLEKVAQLTGADLSIQSVAEKARLSGFFFVEADLRDRLAMDRLFAEHPVDLVIHFAGLKAVGESVMNPLQYYDNNVNGSLVLCEAMKAVGVKKIIFSSSATVYGDPHLVPIREHFPLSATNPYGRSKLFVEEVLQDIHRCDSEWSVVLLRYFNPVGAHKSGMIGENPKGVPNNLMPYISQVAVGQREYLSVFGGDYPTHDGTGVRDYIHVVDLAKGHVKAIEGLTVNAGSVLTVNLGTGVGYSVLEMVSAFEKASGRTVPYQIVERRMGDIAECYADPAYAGEVLGWKAELGLEEMCEDSWRFQEGSSKV